MYHLPPLLSRSEWCDLTGEPEVLGPADVGTVSSWGGGVGGLLAVPDEAVLEFDGNVSKLNGSIEAYEPPAVLPDGANADQAMNATVGIMSLKLRWKGWLLTWRAWRDQHMSGLSRTPASAGVEFGRFKVEYNSFHDELLALGGQTIAPDIGTDAPREPSSVDKVLEFLNQTKWILALGIGAYVLVGTGVVPVLGSHLKEARRP